MKIELLQGSLPVTENPGLDSTDPRFDEISTLVQEEKHAEAANLCESIIADGVYDIRLICYFLYGYWLEQGLTSLGSVVNCLNNVILENWEAVGPAAKREKSIQNSLGWMFRQLLKKVQYEETKNSPTWQQWQASVTSEEVDVILEAGEAFRSGMIRQLEDGAGPVVDMWGKMADWLRALQRLVYRPPEPEQEESGRDDPGEAPADRKAGGMEIEGSYHMNLLLKKLAAFDRLIAAEKFPRAALVADEINNTLANFDPMLYFPKFFETFVRLQALNFQQLAEYAEQRESPEWVAMQEWFKVDIDGFINS